MFGVYFGKYLQSTGVLSEVQVNEILEENKTARVKMGLLAVESGYMSEEQADEVNFLQQTQDKRFGDIAIEKGYLTDAQVGELLKKQGDPYLLFVQGLVEKGYMTLEGIQKEINAYKKASHFTSLDMDALKSNDIDLIVQVFTKEPSIPAIIKDYIALTARNLIRFVDNNLRIDKVERLDEITTRYLASQALDGDYKLLTAFTGEADGLMVIAEAFAKEKFDVMDEDALDAVCEFLNCNNGLFATKVSYEDINVDMLPPEMAVAQKSICSEGNVFKIPFTVQGQAVSLVICMETKWAIK